MNLDVRTLLLATSLMSLVLAIIILSMRRGHSDPVAGLGCWALASLLTPAAMVLGSLYGQVTFLISTVIANALVLVGGALFLTAVRQFNGQEVRFRPVILLGLAALALTWWLEGDGNYRWRMVLVMGVLSACFAAGALALWPTTARASYRRLASASFGGIAVLCGYRSLSALTGLGQPLAHPAVSASAAMFLLCLMMLQLTASMAFILMVTDRVRERLDYLATHDALTGVLARGATLVMATREIARAMRRPAAMSLVIADLDFFKAINDRFGHQAGDQVLKAFATRVNELLRTTDLLGRYGGEEFLVFLPDTDAATAVKVAERIRSAVQEMEVPTVAGPLKVTVSLGVSGFYPFTSGLEEMIAAADRALYEAKNAGRNRVVLAYEPRLGIKASNDSVLPFDSTLGQVAQTA